MGAVEAGIGVGHRYEMEPGGRLKGGLVMGLKDTLWMACLLRVRFVQDDHLPGKIREF